MWNHHGKQGIRRKSTFPCILGNLLATCTEKCLYGYERDVEGNEFCKCLDPCQYIYCNNNTECVVRMINGRHQGVCDRKSKLIDGPTNTMTDTEKKVKGKKVCYQMLPLEAIKCTDNRTKRWYFDSNLKQCKHFRGCQTPGNNFSRKRHCKKQCLGRKRRRHGKRRNSRRRWLRRKRLNKRPLAKWFVPRQHTISESHSVSQR